MEIVIYSEGAISYTEVYQMSRPERELFVKTLTKYFKQKAGKDADEFL